MSECCVGKQTEIIIIIITTRTIITTIFKNKYTRNRMILIKIIITRISSVPMMAE